MQLVAIGECYAEAPGPQAIVWKCNLLTEMSSIATSEMLFTDFGACLQRNLMEKRKMTNRPANSTFEVRPACGERSVFRRPLGAGVSDRVDAVVQEWLFHPLFACVRETRAGVFACALMADRYAS